MALSPNAKVVKYLMDPSDESDFYFGFSELAEGESIATFSVVPHAESAALGLTVGTSSRAPYLATRTEEGETTSGVAFWLSIAEEFHSNVIFDNDGTKLGVVIKIVTTATPSRTFERSLAVIVANR